MTKDSKGIIRQDIKKYKALVEHSNEENREVFQRIVNFLERIIEE